MNILNVIPVLIEAVKYQNFELRFHLISLDMILWGMYAGIIIACALGIYCKRYEGEALRRMIDAEADSPENAKTLEELGLKPTGLRVHALRSGMARKFIRAAGENMPVKPDCESAVTNSAQTSIQGAAESAASQTEEEEAMQPEAVEIPPELPKNLKNARLFIPRRLMDKAFFRYEKKGTSIAVFIAAAVAFFILTLLLTIFIPELTTMLDNLITFIKKG